MLSPPGLPVDPPSPQLASPCHLHLSTPVLVHPLTPLVSPWVSKSRHSWWMCVGWRSPAWSILRGPRGSLGGSEAAGQPTGPPASAKTPCFDSQRSRWWAANLSTLQLGKVQMDLHGACKKRFPQHRASPVKNLEFHWKWLFSSNFPYPKKGHYYSFPTSQFCLHPLQQDTHLLQSSPGCSDSPALPSGGRSTPAAWRRRPARFTLARTLYVGSL